MGKKKNDNRKRVNSLVLLIAFTAILLIISTYAWFSTQRDVALTGLEGTVEVADGLQISLDGQTWGQSVDISNDSLNSSTLAASGVTKSNIVPSTLIPVSSSGLYSGSKLTMYAGTATGTKLESIKQTTEVATDGYYAFDMYLMNSTKGDADSPLQLNFSNTTATMNSSVTATNAGAGVQNAARIGFALFGSATVPVANATTKSAVQTVTNASAAAITQVAIWEPNANQHTEAIVSSNNKLTLSSTDATKYPLTSGKFAANTILPTYAVNGTTTINNVYDWGSADMASNLVMQNTLKTDADGANAYYTSSTSAETDKVYDLKLATDNSTQLKLTKNTVSRIRVYVWIEGQDVDCTNLASFAGALKVNIGLTKDGGDAANTNTTNTTP